MIIGSGPLGGRREPVERATRATSECLDDRVGGREENSVDDGVRGFSVHVAHIVADQLFVEERFEAVADNNRPEGPQAGEPLFNPLVLDAKRAGETVLNFDGRSSAGSSLEKCS